MLENRTECCFGNLFVELLAVERKKCTCPIERFSNARKLLQFFAAKLVHEGGHLQGKSI
jgi:hypothetical protein